MHSIFFDLETSSLYQVGQIINFAFYEVDDAWRVVDKFVGRIRVNRLQLPEAGALVANRTDILEHQEVAEWSEAEALEGIVRFINGVSKKCGDRVPLIGHNIVGFDIPFLRVSLARNGFDPGLPVVNRDFLLILKTFYIENADFRAALDGAPKSSKGNLVFKLEAISRAFGLLEGEQLHESSFDVELNIKVAKYMYDTFGLDCRSYETIKGEIIKPFVPYRIEWMSGTNVLGSDVKTFVHIKGNTILGVNLDKYKEAEDRKSIEHVKYFNREKECWIVRGEEPEFGDLSAECQQAFKTVTPDKIFSEQEIDIESYPKFYSARLNYKNLFSLMRGKEIAGYRPNEFEKDLVRRFRLANCEIIGADLESEFRDFVSYKYGGKMPVKDKNKVTYYKTYAALLKEVSSKLEEEKDEAKRKILSSLKEFYLRSEIGKVFL